MKKAIILSLMLHVTILACFLIGFDQILKQPVGLDQSIPVYVYTKPIVFEQKEQFKHHVSKKRFVEEMTTFKKEVSQPVFQARLRSAEKNNGFVYDAKQGEYAKLLILLHDLIQTHIQYSDFFLGFKRRQMRVSFLLFPDGHVENIQILQSSGRDTLDEAAFTAVQSIQPVTMARNFLKDKKRFEVPIMFIG